MNFDNDIDSIVKILSNVFPKLILQDNKIKIEGEEELTNEEAIKTDKTKNAIFAKICKNLSFLYTNPIVNEPLKVIVNEPLKVGNVQFGIKIAPEALTKLGAPCNSPEIQPLQEYFYLKLKIIVLLNQIIRNNRYIEFLNTQRSLSNPNTENINQANAELNQWETNLQKVINQIKSNEYNIQKLREINDQFFNPNQDTINFCKSLIALCPYGAQDTNVCDNANLLSVTEPITCASAPVEVPSPSPVVSPETSATGGVNAPSDLSNFITQLKINKLGNPDADQKNVLKEIMSSYFQNPDSSVPTNYVRPIPRTIEDLKTPCYMPLPEELRRSFVGLNNLPIFRANQLNQQVLKKFIDDYNQLNLLYSIILDSDVQKPTTISESEIQKAKQDIQSKLQTGTNIENINSFIADIDPNIQDNPILERTTYQLSYYCNSANDKTTFSTDCNDSILNDLSIIKTIGDGTCLLHAFLISVSQNYRNSDKKRLIGEALRADLINRTTNLEQKTRLVKPGTFLETDDLKLLCQLFKINIFLFQYLKFETPGGEKQTIFKLSLYKVEDPNVKKYICMFYSSSASHYSSVKFETLEKFILDEKDEASKNMIDQLKLKIDPNDKKEAIKSEFEIKPIQAESFLNQIGSLFDMIQQGQSENK
jgi:hypothetical protein